MSLQAFAKSLSSASTVLILFLCFVLTTSAIAMIMLRGVYTENGFYENNQYFDFSTTFFTLLVYTAGGDNFVEASTIGFRDSVWYALFFVFSSVMGMFFITSLLIEAFCGSYEENQNDVFVLRKRNERRSLCAVMLCWSRHSYHSIAIYGDFRNTKLDDAKYLQYTEDGLTLDAFTDLIMANAFSKWDTAGWAQQLRSSAGILVSLLEGAGTISPDSSPYHMTNLLLNLLAEMTTEDLFNRLCSVMSTNVEPLAARRGTLLMWLPDMFGSASRHTQFTFEQINWARGLAPEDHELEEALALLPELLGLDESKCTIQIDANGVLERGAKGLMQFGGKVFGLGRSEDDTIDLFIPICQLVRTFYLQKWRMHRIFHFMDDSGDQILQHHECEQVWMPMLSSDDCVARS